MAYQQWEVCPGWYVLCSSRSFRSDELKSHIDDCRYVREFFYDRNTGNEEVTCAYCPAAVWKSELSQHFRECPGAFVCEVCGETMALDKEVAHRQQHIYQYDYQDSLQQGWDGYAQFPCSCEPQMKLCQLCSQQFASNLIAAHEHECRGNQLVQCPTCPHSFSQGEIQDHAIACSTFHSMARFREVSHETQKHGHSRSADVLKPVDLPSQRGERQLFSSDYNFGSEEFGPESYEELLRLDGEQYERGQGLEEEKIQRFPQCRNKAQRGECPICKSALQDEEQVRRLPCMHVFHAACIDEWLSRKPTCPVDNMDVRLR